MILCEKQIEELKSLPEKNEPSLRRDTGDNAGPARPPGLPRRARGKGLGDTQMFKFKQRVVPPWYPLAQTAHVVHPVQMTSGAHGAL